MTPPDFFFGLYLIIFAPALPRQPREFADGQWPCREARAVWLDVARMQAARGGEHVGHRRAAHPALARSHAAARECLQLVQSLTAKFYRGANLSGGHFLAAADHYRIVNGNAARRE